MDQALRNSNEEQVRGVLRVVTGQLPQHSGETRIIRPSTDKTESKDRIVSYVRIVVVAVFVQYIQD